MQTSAVRFSAQSQMHVLPAVRFGHGGHDHDHANGHGDHSHGHHDHDHSHEHGHSHGHDHGLEPKKTLLNRLQDMKYYVQGWWGQTRDTLRDKFGGKR